MTKSVLISFIITLAITSGCAASSQYQPYVLAQPVAPRPIPKGMDDCPKAPPAPKYPQAPRTTESIAAWAKSLEHALAEAQEARNTCADRLRALVDWIQTR